MSKKEEIRKKALEVLSQPEFKSGIRFTALVKKVVSETGIDRIDSRRPISVHPIRN